MSMCPGACVIPPAAKALQTAIEATAPSAQIFVFFFMQNNLSRKSLMSNKFFYFRKHFCCNVSANFINTLKFIWIFFGTANS